MEQSATPGPDWFRRALETPHRDRRITVEGCPIHYRHWGDPDKPGLLLVHGNGAHSHWWDFIAPFFLDHYQVAALDLAGMGDSGHRRRYAVDTFTSELMRVCADAGFGSDTVIVGHSFGGFVTLQTGLSYADRLRGVVLVDSPVRPPDYNWEHDPRRSPIRPKRLYPDRDTALSRFRLMPPQPCENHYIVKYIARHSLAQVEGGWMWKFDDQLFKDFRMPNQSRALSSIPCRVAVIYGQQSELFTQDIADYMFQVLDSSVPFVAIPEARHHLFLDQPLAFVSALRTLLAEWRHSRPNRRAPGP